jgi:hypothetical protein
MSSPWSSCMETTCPATAQGPDAPRSLQATVQVVVAEHANRPSDALVIIRGGDSATDDDLALPCPVPRGRARSWRSGGMMMTRLVPSCTCQPRESIVICALRYGPHRS